MQETEFEPGPFSLLFSSFLLFCSGAATLLAFGLGTLPNLMLAGLLLARFRDVAQAPALRVGSGIVVLAFGAWGLFNAASLGGRLWQGVVCTV